MSESKWIYILNSRFPPWSTDQTLVIRPELKVSPIRPFTISAYDRVNIVIEAATLLAGQQ